MTHDILLHHIDHQGALKLTLNDGVRRNALSVKMLGLLLAQIKHAGDRQDIKLVIIAANGPVFSAGHDLKEITQARAEEDNGLKSFQNIMKLCSDVMMAIVNCPKPVIAQIDGVATAAGCQLVASCDLAYASTRSRFATPGVNIGLFCSTPMVALSRNISNKQALEMLLTGDMISADKAQSIGLINQVVAADQLEQSVQHISDILASKSSRVLSIGKAGYYRQKEMGLKQAYAFCCDVMVENMMEASAQEGIEAFLQKRKPSWSG